MRVAIQLRNLAPRHRVPNTAGRIGRGSCDRGRRPGENVAQLTPPVCPLNDLNSLPVAASQMRAVLSMDAVTMSVPSGENAAARTGDVCPSNRMISRPETTSQMRAV